MTTDDQDDIRSSGWESSKDQSGNSSENNGTQSQVSDRNKSARKSIPGTNDFRKISLFVLVFILVVIFILARIRQPIILLFVGILILFIIFRFTGILDIFKGKSNRYIIGQVRNIRERNEPIDEKRSRTVLTFLVENYDPQGNRLQPTPVEMKGANYSGFVREGDEVQFRRKTKQNKVQYINRLYNLSTETIVEFKRNIGPAHLQVANFLGWTLWFIIMLAIFAAIIGGIISIMND